MDLWQLSGIQPVNLWTDNEKNIVKPVEGNSFDSFLKAFTDMYKETDATILNAGKIQTDWALGKTDDIVSLTLAMEKANASLNFTVQVTSKIIEAYREIMRMQM